MGVRAQPKAEVMDNLPHYIYFGLITSKLQSRAKNNPTKQLLVSQLKEDSDQPLISGTSMPAFLTDRCSISVTAQEGERKNQNPLKEHLKT